jgi:UDPglucose 6-dehydrogenase
VNDKQPIGVIGAGWVGLVTAACFADLGHRVVVREIVPGKVDALRRGKVPIHEPGLSELIERNGQLLTFTTDMAELLDAARLIFVCVQTPPTHSGDADLSAVQRAIEEIGDPEGKALVMKSTVPVGTGRSIRRDAPDLAYVSCPEFLREGTAVRDFMGPDRIVIGVDPGDEWAGDEVAAAYEPLGAPIVQTDLASAEMIKLASNAYLATKISFINEIANVCDQVGADVTEVAKGMGLDPRIGPRFLNAGLGFGGSCFPKDTQALKMLAGNIGYHFQLLNSVIEVNELQKRRVMSKLSTHLDSLVDKRVAMLGLAFKPDTDDMREASSLVLASRLEGEGATVVAFDPVAEDAARELLPKVEMAGSALDALDGADAAILVTEWPEFAALDWAEVAKRMANPLLVDGRNFLDPDVIRAAGITYEAIGRPSITDRSAVTKAER